MDFVASTRYYLYRSPWFMTFMVSGLALFFVIALVFEGAIPEPYIGYTLAIVVLALGVGAAGMGFEVASEMDE